MRDTANFCFGGTLYSFKYSFIRYFLYNLVTRPEESLSGLVSFECQLASFANSSQNHMSIPAAWGLIAMALVPLKMSFAWAESASVCYCAVQVLNTSTATANLLCGGTYRV